MFTVPILHQSSIYESIKVAVCNPGDWCRGFIFIGLICHDFRMMVEFSYRTRRIMDGMIWDGLQTEESTLRQVADAMVKTGLRDLGYQHLVFFFRCFWRDVFETNDLGRRNVEESECLFLKVHGTSDLNLPWFHAPLSRAQALYIFTKDWHQKSLERHFQANLWQTHSSNSLIPSYSH